MELEQIKAIIVMMKENDLSEFSMEQDGLKIRIKRGPEGFQQTVSVPAPVAVVAPAAVAAPHSVAETTSAQAVAAAVAAGEIKYITSPMVGTFYRAPSPESPPYVEAGQAVDEETVVCIVEAMKVMNEIKAEIKGTITEVLVENAKPIEFGLKLFAVRVR